MGNSDSKLVLKQGIFRLSAAEPIDSHEPYWRGFYELPSSPDDIFSLFTAADIRRARDSSLKNLETLILTLTSRLSWLRQNRSFPQAEAASERHALNCVRVLTRILPYVYEDEKLVGWEEALFWEKRRRRKNSQRPEVLFGDAIDDKEGTIEDGDYEDVRPLGEELIDTLVDLLFLVGFTVPPTNRSKDRVNYAIWQPGVGCTTMMNTTKEIESNRAEVVRLLLTLASKSLYLPAHLLPVNGVRALTYLTTCPDKQIVLSLLCSLLNTVLNYNPASWRVPYDHVVYKDPKQLLVNYALDFLLTLLLYTIPEKSGGHVSRNNFRHFLGRLHRLQDFDFLSNGMTKTLKQPLQISSSYLPGSQKALTWAPEMIMLFWETLQCNKRFRSYIIDGDRKHEYMTLMIFYAHEYRIDQAKQGVVRMCVFVLQTLSTEENFGKLLNERFGDMESLPPSLRIPDFEGSFGDLLIISIHNLMTASKGKLDAIYPSLLATINNVAPHLEHLSAQATTRLLQLVVSMSSPRFMLANETNQGLLHSLLESLNSIIEHQYENNRTFIQAIFKYRRRFEALRSFTLDSGLGEIQRRERSRKEEAMSDATSPTTLSRNSSIDSIRSPSNARSPKLSNVPEDGTFAIGEDDDSSDEEGPPLTPAQSSPSGNESRGAPILPAGEALPPQLRGMSEKARGKMPVGQPSFSRQNSSTSLSNTPTATQINQGAFAPTTGWIDTWLPTLPSHTILTLLSHPSPPKSKPNNIETSPPRVHFFEWTPLSLGWYEGLLWGFIFAAEMVVHNGAVGVWNGTNVRLFKVQHEQATGPSLMKPLGAVDAVGSRLVSGIGNLRIRGGGTATEGASPAIRDV